MRINYDYVSRVRDHFATVFGLGQGLVTLAKSGYTSPRTLRIGLEREFLREFKEHLARIGYAAIHVEQYRHFRLLDNSNFPVLDVICKEVVEEEPGPEPQTVD